MSAHREDVDTSAGTVVNGVVEVAADGRVLRADAPACASLGLQAEDIVGRPLDARLTLDAGPGERRYVRPDGAVAWLVVEGRPGPDGQTLVHLRDVTAARLVAQAEREGSELHRATIEGSWIIDAQSRTVSISPSTAALLGYRPQDMLDRSPVDFVAPEDADRLREEMERRRRGERDAYEIRWLHRDGHRVWALMAVAPIRDADGRFAGSFGLVTDVTERRVTEERLTRQARLQAAVARIGRRSLEGADVASLFDEASRESAEVVGSDFAGVFVHEGGRSRLAAVHGLPAGAPRDLEITHADALPPLERLESAEPVIVADFEHEEELLRPAYAVDLGVRSAVAVPIVGRATHGIVVVARRVPFDPDEAEVRYLQAIANVLALSIDRAAAEVEGRERAMHDALTGLPNRTLALDRLDQALRRDRRGLGPLVVIAVDLDRFKRVNDTFGVAAGDQVVRAVGAHLRALVRPADTVARMAGDTLLVICEELADESAAAALAGRIVEGLRTPVAAGDEEVELTVSVGVAIAGDGDRAGELVRDAEAAVERAKLHGRNRFELFDPGLRALAAERVQLERDLRQAAVRGELVVAHQPIVSVTSGRVTGTEALVRWRHPERGIVPPGDFIGIAEESGLIADIGAWVLRRACADVAERHRAGRRITCHVNLSPRQVADPRLIELVGDVLRDTGLPPDALVLELTETSVMEAGEGPLRTMQELRGLGVRIVLDDFGTGYSSLGRLRAFPIDGLKIDRSFVADLDSSEPADTLIVAGIVELARALGLTVVAEGVETVGQLRRLERIGCRYAQGYLLARPAGAEELDRLLASDGLLPDVA